MSDLSSLIARLEEAEWPDRGIDRDIADAFGFGPGATWARPNHQPGIHCMDVGDWTKGNRSRSSERYTSSIDAAVSLAERVVAKEGRKLICFFCAGGQLTPYNAEEGSPDFHPKAKIDNSVTVGWMSHVAFYNEDGTSEGDPGYSHGRTAALAICLSTLRSLQQKGSSNG